MNTKKVCLASFSHFVCDVNAGSLPAILPYCMQIYGMSYGAVSGLMLANASIGSLVQPLFGLLADKHPKAWCMPLGILIAGLGMAALGCVTSYCLLFCSVAISGLGAALFHPAAMRFTNAVAGTREGTATSLFSIGGNLGFLLAPLFAVVLIETLGISGILLLAPLGLCMSALIWYESRTGALTAKPKAHVQNATGPLPDNNWSAFARLTGALIGRSVLMVGLRLFLPLFWIARHNASSAEAATILTLFSLSGIVGNIAGGMLADRFGFLRVIRISYVLMVPLVFFVPFVTNTLVLTGLVLLLGFFCYASFSPVVVVGQRYLAKNVGFAAGITLGLGISVGGLFTPVLGVLADTFGIEAAFHTMTAIALISLLCTLLLVPVSQKVRA